MTGHDATPQRSRKLSQRWVALPFVVAIIPITANVLLLTVATSDPSFAVEPDYYAKALQWDEHMAEVGESARLGWQAKVLPGHQHVTISLEDAAGRPVVGAQVSAAAFPVARSLQRREGLAVEGEPGAYRWRDAFERAGRWTFQIRARRGADVFVHRTQVDLP